MAWLFLSVSLLPKDEAREQRSNRAKCFGTCLRSMTFCFDSCRPLLGKDQSRVIEATRNAGTCSSLVFIIFFLLLQMVPPLALGVGLLYFYPKCECQDIEYCQKCIFELDFIPIGSCMGVTIFFSVITSLASLAFAAKAFKTIGIIRNVDSYAATVVVHAVEQELTERESTGHQELV